MKQTLIAVGFLVLVIVVVFGLDIIRFGLCVDQGLSPIYCIMK